MLLIFQTNLVMDRRRINFNYSHFLINIVITISWFFWSIWLINSIYFLLSVFLFKRSFASHYFCNYSSNWRIWEFENLRICAPPASKAPVRVVAPASQPAPAGGSPRRRERSAVWPAEHIILLIKSFKLREFSYC